MKVYGFDFDPVLTDEYLTFGAVPYHDDARWIAPFKADQRRRLRKGHPFLQYSSVQHFLVKDGSHMCGRISAIHNSRARMNDELAGYLGFFECENNSEAATLLIDAALDYLRRRGVTVVYGPLDGSTWYRYRFVAAANYDIAPPFYDEPYNPAYYLDLFRTNGFSAIATYYSSWIPRLEPFVEEMRPYSDRFYSLGYRIRAYRPRDLPLLFGLSRRIFRNNFAYTDCDYSEFREANRRNLTLLPRGSILFALDPACRPIGFIVTAPDYADLIRPMKGRSDLRNFGRFLINRSAPRILIVRTIGVLPGLRRVPVGRVLFAHSYRNAMQRGCDTAIHALMIDGNESLRINAECADTSFRRYELYSRTIG